MEKIVVLPLCVKYRVRMESKKRWRRWVNADKKSFFGGAVPSPTFSRRLRRRRRRRGEETLSSGGGVGCGDGETGSPYRLPPFQTFFCPPSLFAQEGEKRLRRTGASGVPRRQFNAAIRCVRLYVSCFTTVSVNNSAEIGPPTNLSKRLLSSPSTHAATQLFLSLSLPLLLYPWLAPIQGNLSSSHFSRDPPPLSPTPLSVPKSTILRKRKWISSIYIAKVAPPDPRAEPSEEKSAHFLPDSPLPSPDACGLLRDKSCRVAAALPCI